MSTEFELHASDEHALQELGTAVAISGNYAIAGAPTGGLGPGGAYIYEKTSGGWTERAKVAASDFTGTLLYDHFGGSVAIDGDYAVVGAPYAGDGQAYVFHRSGTNWAADAVLAPSATDNDSRYFGQSVALNGDWAVVGCANAAYMFQRTGSAWAVQAKLSSAGITEFGRSVSISGNFTVVGATNSHTSLQNGAACVFERIGTTWQPHAVVSAPDGSPYDLFGWSVSISGDYLIVGAPNANTSTVQDAGGAYVYVRSGAAWIQQTKLEPPAGPGVFTGTDFGKSVSINGDYALVGEPSDHDVVYGNGAAYLYQRYGLNWILAEKMIASDPGLFAYFGWSAALDSTSPLAVVGARSKDGVHADEGRAYVFTNFPVTLPGAPVDPNRFVLVAWILWGLVAGGRGVIWQPGTGPVPVDPEPFRQWSAAMSPSKRDLLTGLALSEIADLTSDRSSRRAIQSLALSLMEAAVAQMRNGKVR